MCGWNSFPSAVSELSGQLSDDVLAGTSDWTVYVHKHTVGTPPVLCQGMGMVVVEQRTKESRGGALGILINIRKVHGSCFCVMVAVVLKVSSAGGHFEIANYYLQG